jgi:uncharacterized repeat protein (TIGR01451 family)
LNERIYGLQFKGSVDNPEDVDEKTKKQLLDELIENAIVEQEAQRLDISLSDEEIKEEMEKLAPYYETLTSQQQEIVRKNARASLLKEKVKEKVISWYEGKRIEIHFEQHFVSDPSKPADVIAKEEAERERKIETDRRYADDLAQQIYEDVTTKKLEFSQAMEKVNSDTYIDYASWSGDNRKPCGEFSTKHLKGQKMYADSTFEEELSKLKRGGISKPFITKLDFGENEPDLKESMWVIVKLERKNEGEANSYEDWFENQKNKLKVKIYKYSSLLEFEKAYAVEAEFCGEGRSSGSKNNPGDLVVRTLYIDVSGGIHPEGAAKVKVSTAPGSWSYKNCPAGTWEASAEPNGCIRRFLHTYTGADRINLCCGDKHSPHKLQFIYTGGANGYWDHTWWYENQNGGGGVHTLNGSPTSNEIEVYIYNGYTYYMDAYWKLKPSFNDISITKSSNPPDGSEVNPGDVIEYTLTLRNVGAFELKNLVVEDWLPPNPGIETKNYNISYEDGSQTSGGADQAGYDSSNPNAQGHPPHLWWFFNSLGPGQAREMKFKARVKPWAKLKKIRLSDGNEDSNGVYTAWISVAAGYNFSYPNLPGDFSGWKESNSIKHPLAPNISMNKSANPPSGNINSGDEITYTIQIENTGGDAFNVCIEDWVQTPTQANDTKNYNMQYIEGSIDSGGTNQAGYDSSNPDAQGHPPHLWWFFAAIYHGETKTISFKVRVRPQTELVKVNENTGQLDSGGDYYAWDSAIIGYNYSYPNYPGNFSGWRESNFTRHKIKESAYSLTIMKEQYESDGTTPNKDDNIWNYSISGPSYSNTVSIPISGDSSSGVTDIPSLTAGDYTVTETSVSPGSLDDWNTEPASRKITLTFNPGNNLFLFKNTKKSAPAPKGWWPFWREIAP